MEKSHSKKNKKRPIIIILLLIFFILIIYFGIKIIIWVQENQKNKEIKDKVQQEIIIDKEKVIKEEKIEEDEKNNNEVATIKSIQELNFKDTDGNGKNYTFEYNNTTFKAQYTKNNWKIVDSYKIQNEKDMEIICTALIKIHKIVGKDGKSYRTTEDMVYEWKLHNSAYEILPENSKWKSNAKDVDFDSADQGRNLQEIIKDRLNI